MFAFFDRSQAAADWVVGEESDNAVVITDQDTVAKPAPPARVSGDTVSDDTVSDDTVSGKAVANSDGSRKNAADGPLTDTPDKADKADKAEISDEIASKTIDEAVRTVSVEEAVDKYSNINAATLKGIQPGTSTTKQLLDSWGKPVSTQPVDGTIQHVYKIPGFKKVEVYTEKNIVKYILVSFNQSFQPDAVAQQLKFGSLQYVKIYDVFGRALGQAYPERGVAFSYDAGKEPPAVSKILMEPISAESFVARAEKNWQTQHESALRDVDIAIRRQPEHARAHWIRSQNSGSDRQE